ncbi:Ig-like domain-containing protein, partial [Shewanella marina]|uniref:Ig-like domain-containing protein n=1 Tax=Shewanella marina TaxID=487319 RepID=UPI000470A425
ASASKDSVHASVTTTDKAGNSATAETDHIYSIDTKIDAEITITKIAEDDVINATEAKGQVAISGTVDKDVKAGDIVHLTVDGKDLGSAIVKADLTWTVQVDGATLASASKDSVHASVTATDKAGNTKTAETDHVYSIDTQIAAAITITHIAEDDVINATEAKGKVTVSGTVGADVKAGDIVHLTVDGKDLGSATVNTDLTWSTQVDGATLTSASKDSVHASVTATDKAGNSATAETDHIYSIDTKIDAEITINSITADNVINMAERQQTIKVSGAVGKDVQEGDLVTIKIAGKNYTTKVDAQHHWSVGISGTVLANADTDTIFASVTTHDAAGNTAVANTSHVYQVSDIKVGITIDPVTGDNIIDATESTSDKSIAITGHVSGNAKVGDIVELHLGSQNLLTKVIDTSSGLGFSTSVATSEIDDLINQSSGRLDVSATIKISNAYGDAASAHTSEIVTAEGLVEEYPSTSDNISGTPFKDIIFADDDKPDMVSQATDISVVLDVSGSMSAAPITASVLGMKPDEDSVHVYFKMKDGYVYDGNMTREYLNSTAYELSPLEIEYPGITVTHQDHSVDYIYPDKIPNRLDIAKESILLLEHNIESDMLKYRAHDIDKVTFNLVTFDYEIRLDTHFHWDGKTEQFVNADGKTMTQVFEAVKPEGGTDYDAALTKALKDFSDPKARNILYFVSDGDDNNGLSTATITQAVGAQHIKDTHPEIVTIAVSKDVRTHILQDIAAMGEGYKSDDSGQSHFVKVVNPDQLKEVFLSESEKLMSGNDTVNAGAGDDIVISDIIDFDWLKAQIKGTPVNDKIIDLIEQAASEQNGHQVDKQSDEFYDYVKDHISQLTNENQNFYGNDTVNGGDGNDLLFTGGGRDIVNGQAGNDVINTGSDDDTVLTGQGTDTITTGDGQDTIVIVKEAQQESFNSIITDFTGQDKIDLSQLLNNNTSIDNILNNVSSASIKNDELVIDFKGNNEKKITIEHISQSYNDLGSSTHDIINNLFDHQVFNVDHNS